MVSFNSKTLCNHSAPTLCPSDYNEHNLLDPIYGKELNKVIYGTSNLYVCILSYD